MADRKPAAPWIAGALLLLVIGGYVGAYYSMVRRVNYNYAQAVATYFDVDQPYTVEDVMKEVWRRRIFYPMHWLDQKLRSRYWQVGKAPQIRISRTELQDF
jgi:hypothetical protein